ncbi:MAG: hypothetical protein Q7T92_02445 [Lutibacter sp.]|nr:hypothetical protein [Lutibacter sp.]
MKKIFLFSFLLVSAAISFAQQIPPKSIEDDVIGWMKVYHFKGVKEAKKVDDKLYSAAQLSICDSLANWIQASYIPKGGLGDVKKAVSEKLGLYNQYTAALPQSYGAYAKTYVFLKYDSNHKMVPENNLGTYWGIYANQVPGWPIRDLSTPTQYYFTMPSFEASHLGEEQTKKIHDLSKVSNVKPYISFWVKDIEAGGGTDYVLLCKNNKSPFIKLTKGEYLQLLEMAIPRFYENEKRKINEQNKGNQRSIDYLMNTLNEKNERFVTGLKKTKEKYKNRLEEIALTTAQPSIYGLEFGDVFSSGTLSDPESTAGRVPVYKIDPAMTELSKKDKPQWILVSWWWSPLDAVEKYLHESIINNFNFDYVYNFFFNPEKVKGQPYKPLRSPVYEEKIVVIKPSEASNKNAAAANIHFFEDFSTTEIGKKPIGWQTKLVSDGSTSVVTKLDGLGGNWAVLKGHYVGAASLKKPLPQNFTLSYELNASQNFTWGAKGLTMQLAKETTPGNAESYLKLKLRPGSGGADGEATLETKFPSGYANETKWYVATGFSNNKKNNRITLTIKKSGENLQVFVDKNKIGEYKKAMPATLLFNALSFDCNGNSAENDKYYISNIKITTD